MGHSGAFQTKITVLLADDHKIVRQGVRALLEYEQDIEIVGEASDGAEALELLETLRPDILVTDFSMPRFTGIELAKIVRQRSWLTKVVILTMHSESAYVEAAFNCGARAYILKESGVEHTVLAIREALNERRYVSPPLILP